VILCSLDDLGDPGAKGPITVMLDGEPRKVFLIRYDGQVRAYVDACPHLFVPLEMEDDKFLDMTGTEIMCAVHGARFDPLTGGCVWGPCLGRRLTPVEVTVADGLVLVENPQ